MSEKDRILLRNATVGCSIALLLVTYGFMRTAGGFSERVFIQQVTAWCLLLLGYGLSERGVPNRWVLIGLVIILVSSYIAIPLSVLGPDGTGYLMETVMTSVWLTPLLAYYFMELDERVFYWVLPLLFVHTGAVLYKSIVQGWDRANGLLHNEVPAGGVLVVGSIILMNTRYRWAVPVLLLGVLHTGTRAALLAGGICLGGMIVQRRLLPPLIPTVASVLAVGIIVWATYDYLPQRFQVFGARSTQVVQQGQSDTERRLEQTHSWSFLPSGYIYTAGLHNLFQRVAVELGLVAAGVLLVLTLGGLVVRPYFSLSWWVLLSLILLSVFDYYTFLGAGAVLWWVCISLRVREYATRKEKVQGAEKSTPETVPGQV